MNQFQHISFSTGSTQAMRALPALYPASVEIDGKDISDFLQFIQNYSRLIAYWNAQDLVDGSWEAFFVYDLSFFLSKIEKLELSTYPREFHQIKEGFVSTVLDNEKEIFLVQALELCLSLGRKLAGYFQDIETIEKKTSGNQGIIHLFDEVIQSNLSKKILEMPVFFQKMYVGFSQNPNFVANQNLGGSCAELADEYYKIFGLTQFDSIQIPSNSPHKKELFESLYNSLWIYWEGIFQSLISTLQLLQKKTKGLLLESLAQNDHSPQVALLLGFWAMYQESRKSINSLSSKHLDFYFEEVLLAKPLAGKAATSIVTFELQDSSPHFFLEKGTQLSAGVDPSDQEPLIFLTDRSLSLSQNKLAQLRRIFNPCSNKDLFKAVQGKILSGIFEPKQGQAFPKPFFPFGNKGLPANNVSQDLGEAEISILIIDPVLLLSEGKREIKLQLSFLSVSIQALASAFLDLGRKASDFESDLILLFSQGLSLSYSSKTSWISIPLHSVDFNISQASSNADFKISIQFELAPQQPPLIPFNPPLNSEQNFPDGPGIKLSLLQEAEIPFLGQKSPTINPYPLLSLLKLGEVGIEVKVKGAKNFILQNEFSLLNPQKPFPPLGIAPQQHAEFIIGSPEIFEKKLNELSVLIQWMNLPDAPKGFADYYSIYNFLNPLEPFYNSVFKWSAYLRRAGQWFPLAFDPSTTENTDSTSATQTNSYPLFRWKEGSLPSEKPKLSALQKLVEEIEKLSPKKSKKKKKKKSFTSRIEDSLENTWKKLRNRNKPTAISSKSQASPPSKEASSPTKEELILLEGKLEDKSSFGFSNFQSIPASQSSPAVFSSPSDRFTEKSQSGFFRFVLENPPYGFGKDSYLQINSARANYNMKQIIGIIDPKKSSKPSQKPDEKKENIFKEISGILEKFSPILLDLLPKTEKVIFQGIESRIKTLFSKHGKSAPADHKLLKAANIPFVPKIKELSINYSASSSLKLNSSTYGHQIIHQSPLPNVSSESSKELEAVPFLPLIHEEGYLFMGVSVPPDTFSLSLLFEIDPSTGDHQLPIIHPLWEYFQDGRWTSFPKNSFEDGTMGFIQTGIVSINKLSAFKNEAFFEPENSTATPALSWIRITVGTDAQSASSLLNIVPNAVNVHASDPPKSNVPLANQIKKTLHTIPQIKKVLQNTPIEGGIPPETKMEFYVRLSEHLRHKGRAITSWDFEHIILQAFPEVDAVRCVNNLSPEHPGLLLPATISIILWQNSDDISQAALPKAKSRPLLLAVKNYLQALSSPNSTIVVASNAYLSLRISIHIVLKEGYDIGQSLKELNQGLVTLITRWHTNPQINPFTYNLSVTQILSFIQGQVYIDQAFDLEVYTIDNEPGESSLLALSQSDVIQAPYPWIIFRSVAQHSLTLATYDEFQNYELLHQEVKLSPAPAMPQSPTSLILPPINSLFISRDLEI